MNLNLSLDKIKVYFSGKEESKYFLIGFIWIFIFYLPYIILWDRSYVPITDNIELFTNFKPINLGNIFENNEYIIDTQLLGIPRIFYPSEYFYLTLLISLIGNYFNYYTLWFFNLIFITIIGYIGMWKLLFYIYLRLFNDILFKEYLGYIITACSLYFACSPHWILAGISTSGQPLLLYSLLLFIRKEYSLKHLVYIFVFPLFSSLYFSNLYFFPLIFVLLSGYSIILRNKTYFFRSVLGLLILIIITFFSEYRMISYGINPTIETIRTINFNSRTYISWYSLLKETLLMIKHEFFKNPMYFLWGYYDPIQRVDNFVVVITYLVIAPFLLRNKMDKAIYILFIFFILFIMASIGNPLLLKIILSKIFPFFEKIFYSLSMRYIANITQLFWCLMLFHFLLLLVYKIRNKRAIMLISIFFLILNIYQPSSHELNNPIMNNYVKNLTPSFREYIDYQKFNSLRNFLLKLKVNIPQCKFLVFSNFENVKVFNHQLFVLNGFKTIGGYYAIYPKSNFIKLDLLRNKIDKLSYKVLYPRKQITDPRYVNFFLPQQNDSLLINEEIIDYIKKLDKKIFISSLYPLKNIDKNFTSQLVFHKHFKGLKYDIYLYELKNQIDGTY